MTFNKSLDNGEDHQGYDTHYFHKKKNKKHKDEERFLQDPRPWNVITYSIFPSRREISRDVNYARCHFVVLFELLLRPLT